MDCLPYSLLTPEPTRNTAQVKTGQKILLVGLTASAWKVPCYMHFWGRWKTREDLSSSFLIDSGQCSCCQSLSNVCPMSVLVSSSSLPNTLHNTKGYKIFWTSKEVLRSLLVQKPSILRGFHGPVWFFLHTFPCPSSTFPKLLPPHFTFSVSYVLHDSGLFFSFWLWCQYERKNYRSKASSSGL